jgi:RhtB (resistance to homoserine/threonine) family protein
VHLVAFLGVAVVIVLTPGVDMALVTKNALLHGRRAALATALGINAGIAVWTVAAALGLAALVHASATAFAVVKLAGAAYLVYLGVQALRASRRAGDDVAPASVRALGTGHAFRQGLVSNLLNPKIAVLFSSLLPQFVGDTSSPLAALLVLGAVFNLLGVVWLTSYALAVSRGRAVLQRPRVKAALDALSGVVLVALGFRLALERRA